MQVSIAESCQDDRTRNLGSTGTIVLSASCHLLFIDRNAIGLLGTLDSDWLAPTDAQSLPPCLMTMVQEITALSTIDRGPGMFPTHIRQFLGSRSQPIRVQGFMVACHEQQDRRFVLVLSRSTPGPMA
jgi:hypothetical protein